MKISLRVLIKSKDSYVLPMESNSVGSKWKLVFCTFNSYSSGYYEYLAFTIILVYKKKCPNQLWGQIEFQGGMRRFSRKLVSYGSLEVSFDCDEDQEKI